VFQWSNATVASLIQFAYDIQDFELIGGADWIRSDQFEINARAAAPVSNDDKRPMVQSLLEERFMLVVHKEQREMPFTALVLARSDGRVGPKLTRCEGSNIPPPILWPRGGRVSTHTCAPMSVVARLATGVLGTPVVDRTGLTGKWHHELVFADPNRTIPAANGGSQGVVVDPNLASFSTSLQEQLGLKIERRRGPVDVLVVDSIQQPTEN
jgi:uncharacterized protein (TIGR03435 family)